MTNLIEDGFEEIESGSIGISLHDIDRKVKIQISVKDNKSYTNTDFTITDRTESAIVDALVQQIDADLTFENNHAIELVFQKSDAAGSSNALF